MKFVCQLQDDVIMRLKMYLDDIGIVDDDWDNFYNSKVVDVMGIDSIVDAIINNEDILRDDEYDKWYTVPELEELYYELKEDGDTEAETFNEYLANCLDQDGTLEWW